MEEVRQLVQEEGREARNLIAFHVAVDTPRSVSRKPPRVGAPPPRRAAPRCAGAARLRSASAGRDKRSELRARYWALLFGDLQRAIGEIYNTVEAHENLNECQEVILVLENYTRDFKALGEWFRLKWEYDNTPPPQRPQSLAWEIRKTDFVRPESRRTQSVKSSPSVSGKNSPCLSGHNTPSGKNSPNLTGKASPGSGKISPRISGHASTSPKGTIEFFSSKITAKITTKPEPKKETRLSDIKEKDLNVEEADKKNNPKNEDSKVMETKAIETGKVNSNAVPKQVVIKSPKRAAIDEKVNDLSEQAKATIAKLDAMENEFLAKQLTENAAKNDNIINDDMEKENFKAVSVTVTDLELNDKESVSTESPAKSEDNFGDVSNDSSKSTDDKCLVPKGDSDKANEAKSLPNGTEIKKDEDDPMPSDKNTQKDKTTKEPKDSKSNAKPVVENHVTAKAVTNETSNKDEISNSTLENGNTSDSPNDIDGKDFKKDPKKPESKPLTDQNKETDNAKKEDTKKQEPKATEVKTPIKPAYSQAAAKPKQVTAKTEVKPPAKTTLLRSKTVVEIRPSVASKTRQFVNRNPKNKCSYPFNLTTGRTSLFDAPGNKVVTAKKPIIKSQMASGDSRNQTKDIKTRPPRPMSLKINEKGDEKDKVNPGFEKVKDIDDYSSSDTIVAQLHMSRIESSESLKTLVPENGQDVANSIEVLNIDGDSKNDNEGWLTVKSRRLSRESKKSKSHWANRFRQPSATTSLPTLNMIESPKSETNPIDTSKLDRAKSEQPQNVLEPPVKVAVQPKIEKIRDTSMIRQKSDVTGLRTRSSRTKALKKDKKDKKGSELTKNRLHSSLESLTTGLARSQESTEDAFDFDKWKSEFKSTFRYLEDDDQISNHNEILRTADPSEMSEIAEMTSQIEENERKISLALDFQSEVDQRKLSEEEELLNRQIMELQQNSDVDLDTETDDTETDAEIPRECEEGAGGAEARSLAARLEHQYETALAGMSWAERVDTLGALEALVARDPGRAMQLHAKLSAGLRRRGSLTDALRRLQAKQARADTQRNTLATQRKRRIHALLARVEEVKVAKNQLIEEKRIRMERRLQKAAENRDQHLKDIVRKAHDEEEKLREIAFIKQLEAENRRHEFLDQCRSHTTRLREMRRERLDKLAAGAAREAAVGARRAALEQARSHRVALLLQRRQLQHDRQQRLQQQRQQQHKHANREKAEGVRSRLSALARAAEAEAAALRTRITSKEAASTQRLQHHLQAIRERATTRTQTTSESHQEDQESREEEQAAARIEQERKDRDKQKSIRKKARKMKQKLMETSKDPRLPESASNRLTFPPAIKLHKVITQLSNIIEPLIQTETPVQNGLVNEEDKPEKKKKNKVKNDENDNNNHEVKTEEVVEKVEEVTASEVKTGEVKEGKKKKKKNKSSDGPKLSKSNSICSSLSDMSRTSVRSEKVNAVADVQTVEKLLNELHRILMANDKWPESSLPTKQFAIKTLGNLVSLAAERDDIVTQFTTKSITTCIVCTSRLICASAAAAECYVWSPHVASTVLLLANILEKDIQADAKDMELAKHTSDCLSVGLDSVLCATRLFTGPEGGKQLAENRARAHSIISYLCLSGCISRAEKAGEVRESIQTLLTLCADLCQPNEVDTGPELPSATQSLRCALGTSLCGSRDEFCMLFAEGAELAKSSSFVRAARTAHLLRAVAELDHIIVQEAFGEGGWPLEFRAAVARLLSQHAPSDKEAPRSTVVRLSTQRLDQTLSETMVLDLIVLVGFVVVNNPQLHETICENWSVVKTLCTLPCNWLVSPTHCHSLLPTLVVLAERADTAPVIAAELSMKMLEEYCDSPDAQKVKLIQVFKQGRERHRKAMKKEQEQQNNEEQDN